MAMKPTRLIEAQDVARLLRHVVEFMIEDHDFRANAGETCGIDLADAPIGYMTNAKGLRLQIGGRWYNIEVENA